MTFNVSAKMRNRVLKSGISFLSVCAGMGVSYAEDPDFLKKALEKTLEGKDNGSFTLLKNESSGRFQNAKKQESLSYFFPNLSLTGNHLLGRRYLLTDILFSGASTPTSIPQILSETQFNLNAQWWIIDGLANFDRLKSASLLTQSIEKEKKWNQFKIERELRFSYYQMCTDQAMLGVSRENQSALLKHKEDADRFFKVGSGTKFDLLRMESELSQADVNVLSRKEQFELSRSKFRELIGRLNLKDSESRELVELLDDDEKLVKVLSVKLPSLSLEEVKSRILELKNNAHSTSDSANAGREDLLALSLRINALQSQMDASAAHYIPKIGIFAQYNYYNNRTTALFNKDDYRTAYQYGVNVSWNLFDGFYSSSRVTQNREDRVQSEIELERMSLQKEEEEKVWLKKLETSTQFIRAREVEVSKAEEASKMAITGRKAGTLTSAQLLDSEVERFRAKAGLLTAKLSQVEALLKLELLTGKSLLK